MVDKKPRNKIKHSLEEIHQARYEKVLKMERSLKYRSLKLARKKCTVMTLIGFFFEAKVIAKCLAADVKLHSVTV